MIERLGRARRADRIAVGKDWTIQNGKHRSPVAVCLGEDFISDVSMVKRVPFTVEPE